MRANIHRDRHTRTHTHTHTHTHTAGGRGRGRRVGPQPHWRNFFCAGLWRAGTARPRPCQPGWPAQTATHYRQQPEWKQQNPSDSGGGASARAHRTRLPYPGGIACGWGWVRGRVRACVMRGWVGAWVCLYLDVSLYDIYICMDMCMCVYIQIRIYDTIYLEIDIDTICI